MQKRDYGDASSGVVLLLAGAAFAIMASEYSVGSLRRMGPGYFPIVIGIVLAAFGLLIAGMALLRPGTTIRVEWRPLVTIGSSILVFALTVERLGLVPATMLLVLTAAAAQAGSKLTHTLALAIGLAVTAVLIFVTGLGMPIATFRWSF
jgi:hypothetical protein